MNFKNIKESLKFLYGNIKDKNIRNQFFKEYVEFLSRKQTRYIFIIGCLTLIFYSSKIFFTHDFKKSYSVKISKYFGKIGNTKLPNWLKPILFKTYIFFYNVNMDEVYEKDLKKYNTFNEFFIRKIDMSKREFDENAKYVSPCDGKILSVNKIEDNDIIIVKNVRYILNEFLFGNVKSYSLIKELEENKNKKNDQLDYYQITIYLSPRDYHRFHSPCDLYVKERVYIPGSLFPVKPSFVNKNPYTFQENERVTLKCSKKEKNDNFFITFVGALNVGSIYINYDRFSNDRHLKSYNHEIYMNGIQDDKENLEQQEILTYLKKSVFNQFDAFEFEYEDEINREILNYRNIKNGDSGIPINKFDEIGHFRFGSTIVLVVPLKKDEKFSDNLKPNNVIKLGEKLII